jgi:hypothetical protein
MTRKSASRQARDTLKTVDPKAVGEKEYQSLLDKANCVPEQIFNEAAQADKARKRMAEANAEGTVSIWDDLENMYQNCVQALASPGVIGAFSQRKDLIALVQDKQVLVARIRMLQSDTEQMRAELNAIHQQHQGKTGGSIDPDELIQAFPLYEYYQLWLQKWNANIMPTVAHILEIFTDAEIEQQRQRAAAQLTPEQDPTVITDVEVKQDAQH